MGEDADREINLDDIIEVTGQMDDAEYLMYMQLSVEDRIDIARELLGK